MTAFQVQPHTTGDHHKLVCKIKHSPQLRGGHCGYCGDRQIRIPTEKNKGGWFIITEYWQLITDTIGQFDYEKCSQDYNCQFCVKDGVNPAHHEVEHYCFWCGAEGKHRATDCDKKCQHCITNGHKAPHNHSHWDRHVCQVCNVYANHSNADCPHLCLYCADRSDIPLHSTFTHHKWCNKIHVLRGEEIDRKSGCGFCSVDENRQSRVFKEQLLKYL